jgi:chemotaxis protein methyltransferase CheR
MKDADCVRLLQWLLPQLQMRWAGFRKVRRQVCRRVTRRMTELGLADVAAYQAWIVRHPEELPILDGLCRITISRFYRDCGVFDRLRDDILPDLAADAWAGGRNELRCWSAGCASGEEPYTVNIIWRQAVLPRMPDVTLKIVATDSDPQMLERASRGCYGLGSLKDFPQAWMSNCFARAGDEFSVRAEYRRGIEWRRQDIREEIPDEVFDLTLCRHLALTYFDEPLQIKTLSRILARLRAGGFLVTGKQERLPTTMSELIEVHPHSGVYRKQAPIGKYEIANAKCETNSSQET